MIASTNGGRPLWDDGPGLWCDDVVMSQGCVKPLGVVEGFFGPEWSWAARHQFCETLRAAGGDFFIYAPKRDPYLRKNWMQDHPPEMWGELKNLRAKCGEQGVQFGVGLSPFEIHAHWNEATRRRLRDKVLRLHDLGTEYLGLFFDDMKGAPDLADKQIEIVDFVRRLTNQVLLFCPTYYSWDPILDRVFGQRPEDYLERIGQGIDSSVQILWTGNKVISDSISSDDLDTVAGLLRREPFVWDNFFANDGPRQCKFLRLKPLTGRTRQTLEHSSGWALNLMNQPSLSEILFRASAAVLLGGLSADPAFRESLGELGGASLSDLGGSDGMLFNQVGLDKMEPETRGKLLKKLRSDNRFEAEILAWLDGQYVVGPECLTD